MLIRDHSAHLCVVRITDQRVAVQVTFPLGGLGGKNMALVSLATLDLAGGSFLEPLGCAFVCFHFRHNFAADALHARFPILFMFRWSRLAFHPVRALPPAVAAAVVAVAAAAAFPASCHLVSAWAEPESPAWCCLPCADETLQFLCRQLP